jgi:hypothetical protein
MISRINAKKLLPGDCLLEEYNTGDCKNVWHVLCVETTAYDVIVTFMRFDKDNVLRFQSVSYCEKEDFDDEHYLVIRN